MAALELPGIEPDQWIEARQPLEIRYRTETPGQSDGRLRFFVGTQDVTGLLQRPAPGVYRYPANRWPLPSGEQDLRVYRVRDGEWQLLDERPLRILSRGGFEESDWQPQSDLSGTGREERSESTDLPEDTRLQEQSLALEAGLQTRHRRNELQIESNWQWVGSSSPEQTLRFDELGSDAPRIDLSDYRISLQRRKLGLLLGQQEQGGNSLLIDQFQNRGVGLSWRNDDRMILSLAAQAARPRVGWSDLLGLADQAEDRVASLGLGMRLPSPDVLPLRLRVDLVSARRVADPGFDEAAVTELATSRGVGLRLTAGDDSIGWSLRLDYARSRHENPPEPFEQEFDEQPQTFVSEDEARAIGLRYALIGEDFDNPDAGSLTLSLGWRRIDPFYQSIAADVTPNELRHSLALEGRWRLLGWQLSGAWSEDNLDDLPTVLKTLTREQQLTATLDLAAMEPASSWMPSMAALTLQRLHQFGDNLPVGFDPDSHVPDQVDLQQALDFEWSLESGSVSLRLAQSEQDNRQPGREQADFDNSEINLSLSTALTDGIDLQLGWARVLASDLEQDIERRSREWLLGLDARIGEQWSASLNWSLTREDDDRNQGERENRGLQLQLSRQWTLPDAVGRLPLQTYLRYTRNDDTSVDRLFDIASDQQSRAWDLGFSLSFF